MTMGDKKVKIIKEIVSWTCHIAIAVVLALVINIFIFQPTKVEGYSMEGTLHDKDRIMVNKLIHTFGGGLDYGNIVIIDSRVDRPHTIKDDLTDSLKYNAISNLIVSNKEEIYWVKRVIGKAGDVLEFRDGNVLRNGKVLEEPYTKEPMTYQSNEKITVPANHIFVMGDNRNNSRDSRYIGCIPLDHVVGKYVFKF